jgi:BirA family biotin operon repressor/biotin-[acetyl-CoA-carboxylase] ligase
MTFGEPLRHLPTVDSTNTEAMRWVKEDPPAPEGAVVWADDQTAGRGRWGRQWVSAPGNSLTFSLVLRPTFGVDRLGLVTIVAGVACAEGIGRASGLATRTKWPNDVLIGGRKVAGVLCESQVTRDGIEAVVVGMGINLDLPADLPADVAGRATSLVTELGASRRPEEVMAPILEALSAHYTALSAKDLGEESPLLDLANRGCETIGKKVVVRWPDGRVETGRAEMILPSGALYILDTEAGEALSVDVAEVEHLREA